MGTRQAMRSSSVTSFLGVLFILSGACGLIYQIVWFKVLALSLGNTTQAQMIVLSVFLGGLALGNHIVGRFVDRLARPATLYGILELTIGLFCLAYPALYRLSGSTFQEIVIASHLYGREPLFSGLRLLFSAALLVVPTVAMGGTLPALSRVFVRDRATAHTDMGILYFLNSFGGILGVFFAGFLLIEHFGLSATLISAAVVNCVIGASALLLRVGRVTAGGPEPGYAATGMQRLGMVARGAVLVAGLSGLAALMYEVLWTRLLITLIGSSTYAFSLVLVAFITGITAGSLLVGQRWSLKAERVRLLILCQLGIAAGTMLALPVFERLPFLLWKLTLYLPLTGQNFGLFLAIEYCCCVLLMLVPTVLMGMSLPLVVGIVTDVNGGRIGRSVGIVFSVNTLGTVVGAVLAGAVLIPAIGIQHSFSVGIGVNVIAAMVMIAVAIRWRAGWRAVAMVALMVSATYYGVAVPPLDQDVLASGIYRKLKETPPGTYQDFLRSLRRRAVVFSSEGAHANVAVMEYLDGSNLRVLTINGKPDASNGQDMPTQRLLGHLPMMLHPNPRSVFVIGLGSGATVGAVLTHPVDSVRCLEIAPEVVDASRYFSDINGNCLDDARLHMTIDDAHTFLRLVPAAYDVIISEPSNPWIAGIGNLFSQEYFAVCRSRLAGGGVMAQWLQTYETDDRIVRLVLNTFQSVFPYTQVWMPTSGDLILLGSDRSLDALPDSLNERFNIPAVRASLRGISIHSIFALLTTQALSSEATYGVTDGEPINTENNPALEFQAPRMLHARGGSSLVEREDERLNGTGDGLLVRTFLAGRDPTQAEVLGALRYHYEQGSAYQITYGLSRYVLDRWGNDFTARLLNIRAQRALGLRVADVHELRDLLSQAPESTQVIHDFVNEEWREIHGASTFLRTYSLRSVAEALTTIAGRDSASVLGLEMRLAELFLRNGEVRVADSICTRMERMLDASPRLEAALPPDQFLYITGRVWLLAGKNELCMRAYQRLYEAMPASPLTKELGRRLNWRLQHNKKG